jgi:uncharacterized protein DUF481
MRWTAAILIFVATASLPAPSASAQVTPSRPAVFFDCRTNCDFDFTRTEITYVDWVRDRAVADVHLLMTSQEAGAGGSAYTLAFIGLRTLAGRGDTLTLTTDPTTTPDERRRKMTHAIALGLMQFVARTEVARTLSISAAEEPQREQVIMRTGVKDRWHAWVFEIGMNGGLNAEHSYRNREINSSIESRRVTEEWKIELTLDHEYRDQRANVQEFDSSGAVISEEIFTNVQRNWSAEGLIVRSVNGRFSTGLKLELSSNTFRNYERALYVAPAIEYNIFPYSESTRREFTVQYGLGYQLNRYVDTTIFDKIGESLPLHYLSASYRTRQPWGSVNLHGEHRNYILDGSKRNTSLGANFDVRVFRGLSVHMGANYNWIRDQIYLPKGEQDQADVLLRRRALQTGFEYELFGGLSYTFGSIFNNVVNTRF